MAEMAESEALMRDWDGLRVADRESIIADWLAPSDGPYPETLADYRRVVEEATQCIYRLLDALCQAEERIAALEAGR